MFIRVACMFITLRPPHTGDHRGFSLVKAMREMAAQFRSSTRPTNETRSSCTLCYDSIREVFPRPKLKSWPSMWHNRICFSYNVFPGLLSHNPVDDGLLFGFTPIECVRASKKTTARESGNHFGFCEAH